MLCEAICDKGLCNGIAGCGNCESMIVDTTFLTVTILSDLLVNGMDMSAFMMIVAGAQIGAVSKSAMPPPIAAAVIAYGHGRRHAAI